MFCKLCLNDHPRDETCDGRLYCRRCGQPTIMKSRICTWCQTGTENNTIDTTLTLR